MLMPHSSNVENAHNAPDVLPLTPAMMMLKNADRRRQLRNRKMMTCTNETDVVSAKQAEEGGKSARETKEKKFVYFMNVWKGPHSPLHSSCVNLYPTSPPLPHHFPSSPSS